VLRWNCSHFIYGSKKRCVAISSTTNSDANAEITLMTASGWCRISAAKVVGIQTNKNVIATTSTCLMRQKRLMITSLEVTDKGE